MDFKNGTCRICKKKTLVDQSKGWWHQGLCDDCIGKEMDNPCDGEEFNHCIDTPVTYCPKCKRMYFEGKMGKQEI